MTEQERMRTYIKLQDSVKDVEKENEILHGKLSVQEKALNNQHEMITKLQKMQKRISDDLELSPTSYRNTTTRSLAEDAFEQSTVTANWEGLGNHPVIKNVYESIMNRSTEEGRRADDIIRRFEHFPTSSEIINELEGSEVITEICSDIVDIGTQLSLINTTQNNDRSHGNQQDLKVRDQIADMQTALDMLEFLQKEMAITFDGAFMFEIGAWARSGFEPVANGLREILKKPKEVETKDE